MTETRVGYHSLSTIVHSLFSFFIVSYFFNLGSYSSSDFPPFAHCIGISIPGDVRNSISLDAPLKISSHFAQNVVDSVESCCPEQRFRRLASRKHLCLALPYQYLARQFCREFAPTTSDHRSLSVPAVISHPSFTKFPTCSLRLGITLHCQRRWLL